MAPTGRSRIGRSVWLVVAAVSAFLATLAAALGFLAVVSRFARLILMPPVRTDEPSRIRRVDLAEGLITLDADADTRLPGRYSFWFGGGEGHARLGAIVRGGSQSVTRELITVDVGDLEAAESGRISGWYYLGPWELDRPYDDVTIPTELGPAPAWQVPAAEDAPTPEGPAAAEVPAAAGARWAIMVHGWSVRRQECLRAIDTFHRAGYTSLLISYRNDGEAPESPDGRYGLGSTEWSDLAAAIRYAEERGAREIVLVGWSMGGSIILQAALRGGFTPAVTGIVLDSPAIDWRDILDFQARLNRLPDPVTRGVIGSLGSSWGKRLTGLDAPIDFTALDVVARADALTIPMLILHSDDDQFVPGAGSLALAAARPDLVTLERWTQAGHAKLWNYDRERWETSVGHWLSAHAASRAAS